MQAVSEGTLSLIIIGQSLVLLAATTVYLAWLSLTALVLAITFVAFGAYLHIARSKEISEQLHEAFRDETEMMAGFTDFIEGFKEVKLNSARSVELGNRVRNLALEVAGKRLKTRELFTKSFVASQIAFFLLSGTMVFVVPLISSVDSPTVLKISARPCCSS
jgi:putative ATP-binding cassette transporter